MKPLTIALIGVGVLGASVGALFVLKAKGIIGNTNPGGFHILTQDELSELVLDPKRFDNKVIEVINDTPEVKAQKLAAFKAIFESGAYGTVSGFNLV